MQYDDDLQKKNPTLFMHHMYILYSDSIELLYLAFTYEAAAEKK